LHFGTNNNNTNPEARTRKFFRWRQRKDDELSAEIQNHLDEAIRDRIARSETP
jgi:hypothetical protein